MAKKLLILRNIKELVLVVEDEESGIDYSPVLQKIHGYAPTDTVEYPASITVQNGYINLGFDKDFEAKHTNALPGFSSGFGEY